MSDEKFNIDIDEMLSTNLDDVENEANNISTKEKINESSESVTNAENEQTEKADFEKSLRELDKIVEELQRSDLALDRSMHLFRRGTELVQICKEQLHAAEQEVKELLADGNEIDYIPENW